MIQNYFEYIDSYTVKENVALSSEQSFLLTSHFWLS